MTETLIESYWCDVEGSLSLTSAWGGENGRVVQLTLGGTKDYVILTFDEAKKFFKKAIREINKIEKRYNESPPWWEEMAKKP